MADNDDIEAGEEEAKKPGLGKKKIIIIAAVVLLLVGGGSFAAYTFLVGDSSSDDGDVISESTEDVDINDDDTDKAEDEKTEDENGQKSVGGDDNPLSEPKDDLGFGETYKLEPFSLNLANLENHYIRLQISLEYSGGARQKKELDVRTPQLRDAIINIIGSKTKEFLLAPDGKDALRKEILIRINRYMKTKIDSVFITDIIIE